MTPPLSELRALLAAHRDARAAFCDVVPWLDSALPFREKEKATRLALEDAMHSALPDLLDRLERAEGLLRKCADGYLGRFEPHPLGGHVLAGPDDALRARIDAFLSEGGKP